MRDALVRAAKAQPGVVGDLILELDRKIKRRSFGGWSVDRKKQRRKSRGRRNRT